jgi:hypothetical protein
MKREGDRLQQRLRQQRETVSLVGADGVERHGVSAKYAADFIMGGEFIGYGKNGVIDYVKAMDAPEQGPFATRRDVTAIMRSFPRLPDVHKNKQQAGAKQWVEHPDKAKLGCGGSLVRSGSLGLKSQRNGEVSTLVSGGLALCQRGERLIQTHTAATPAEVT